MVAHDPVTSDDLASAVYESLNMLLLLDVNVLCVASREIVSNGAALLQIVAVVGTVDAAVAVVSYREGTADWTRPVAAGGHSASMRGLRHPLVSDAVPNSVKLAPPHGILVTGSNMSGKSTFLRTVGVNVVLAQTVNTCLAEA